MRSFRLVIASLALVAVVGCGEADVVSRSEVEKQTQAGLTKSVGQEAPPAKCPKSLKAEVGATTRCTMDFPENKRLGITVKVVEVNGDRVQFDIEADQQLTETE